MPPLGAHPVKSRLSHRFLQDLEMQFYGGIVALIAQSCGGREFVEPGRHGHIASLCVHERGIHCHTPGVERTIAIERIGDKRAVVGPLPKLHLRRHRPVGVPDLESVALGPQEFLRFSETSGGRWPNERGQVRRI